MNPSERQLFLGTCSWKYPSWAGIVYSAPKGIDYLAEYSRRFDSVEVDQWFWSLFPGSRPLLPRDNDVVSYTLAVPESFRFTVKAPNSVSLTHYYSRGTKGPAPENPHFLSADLYLTFLDSLRPLQPKLSLVMLQFEYLNRQKMPSMEVFLERLDRFLGEIPRDIPLGIEIRNPNYLSDDYFAFLAERSIVPVFCQGYYMPDIHPVVAEQGSRFAGGTMVIRLMGPDRQGIEEAAKDRWDSLIEAKDEDLDRTAATIRRELDRRTRLFVNVNNHFEGSAPLTIARLRQRLEAGA